MPKANIKKLIPVLLFLLFLYFSGCGNPEDKKVKGIEEVAQLTAEGNYTSALEKLESLSADFPNDSTLLQAIGSVHQKLSNTVEAAFYFSAALVLDPDNPELLYQNYHAQETLNQVAKAYGLLEKMAAQTPESMTGKLWLRLGELHAQAKQPQAALDAYLKGIATQKGTLETETVVAIGRLYKELDNLQQAKRWLTKAASSNEQNALPALFDLLEIHVHNEDRDAAKKIIDQLDDQFPGAIDASKWADVRAEFKSRENDAAKVEEKLPEIAKAKAVDPAPGSTENTASGVIVRSGKAHIATDVETAEALANKPAHEVHAVDAVKETEPEIDRIAPDPNILIEPAEPKLDDVEDETSQTLNNVYVPDFTRSNDTYETVAALQQTSSAADQVAHAPETLDDLLAQADIAMFENDYETAIRFYWKALKIDKDRADIWNMLSGVYLIDGQAQNAATTALEATRLDPKKVEYVLDYLRVIQNTKKPADFIAELETAYDRFPRNPEINLSLARAYRNLDKNTHAAKIIYRRFIELAPNHPLRSEADAALKEL